MLDERLSFFFFLILLVTKLFSIIRIVVIMDASLRELNIVFITIKKKLPTNAQ